jgi:arsenate reductase
MNKIIFYLSTCSTCTRIIKELDVDNSFYLQDIKRERMKAEQVDEMAQLAGSYEALFSRKAMKFRSMGLKDKSLTEKDYRKLILDEYTFLKRPVLINDGEIFIGNSKSVVAAAKEIIHS